MSDLEQELRQLREDVSRARHTVIELMPDEVQSVLSTFKCETFEELSDWCRDAAEKIVGLADARPASEMGEYRGSGTRAVCPLCGRDSRNPTGYKGFVVPGGLIKHLTGDGNANQCPVMREAWNIGFSGIKG